MFARDEREARDEAGRDQETKHEVDKTYPGFAVSLHSISFFAATRTVLVCLLIVLPLPVEKNVSNMKEPKWDSDTRLLSFIKLRQITLQ